MMAYTFISNTGDAQLDIDIKKEVIDREYLKRCKYSSPETKLNWLAAAVEFARAKKKIVKSNV